MAMFLVGNHGYPANLFDCTRFTALSRFFPGIVDAPRLSSSLTRSRLRVHPRGIHRWNTFSQGLNDYYTNTFTAADSQAMVCLMGDLVALYNFTHLRPAANEGNVCSLLFQYIVNLHDVVARGYNGAPLPSDRHATLVQGHAGPNVPNTAENPERGIPDFAMVEGPHDRLCALIEIKNPWNVTPQSIEEVLNGEQPFCCLLTSRHCTAGRGSCWTYGCRTALWIHGPTGRGVRWCFLWRQNQGHLFMTSMFAPFPSQVQLAPGYQQPNFSTMSALYYLSALAYNTPPSPEIPPPGQVG